MTLRFDPLGLELAQHRFASVAEEMGEALMRSAVSPNIKERRDFSCGVFDARGRLIAHAAHIPVHLGAMSASVQAARTGRRLNPGDVVVLNDPDAGGTHLPDVTVVAPVFFEDEPGAPSFYVANRAHHADIGGMSPGSMPVSRDIYQEGLVIPPITLVNRGEVAVDLLRLLLANVRTPDEREWDLRAQLAVLDQAVVRLQALAEELGTAPLRQSGDGLIAYTAAALRRVLAQLPDGQATAKDVLEPINDQVPTLAVTVAIAGDSIHCDFTTSSGAVPAPINAPRAVTISAVAYVLRCLVDAPVPAGAGLLEPLVLTTRPGSIVDARRPAPVAAGNVETSQRLVDVVLRALAKLAPSRVPAASAGTMLNVAIGAAPGGEAEISYYETVAGGAGAGPWGAGASAIQTHMTNTLNTPVEAIAHAQPFRIVRYAVRRGSGGTGQHAGGDGIERVFEAVQPIAVSVLAERLTSQPYGLAGGSPGQPASLWVESATGERRALAARAACVLQPGERLVVRTPGGGGFGPLAE